MSDKPQQSGLGRGLSGILGDALSMDRAPEVSGLLGAASPRRDPGLRKLVSGLALDAMAEGFGADAVVLVGRDDFDAISESDNDTRRAGEGAALTSISSRLPTGWDTLDAVPFETVGRLWGALNMAEEEIEPEQRLLGNGVSLLICRAGSRHQPMAAALLRSRKFSAEDEATIGRLVRSVAVALRDDAGPSAAAVMQVVTSEATDGVLAEVRIGEGGDERTAQAIASDPIAAVASAATELCDASLTVGFAGQTLVQESLVTIVVLEDHSGGPLFGLAVGDPSSATGPVEAVLSAARVANVDPFVFAS